MGIKRVIYPGSFDPVTYGHLDLVERAMTLFDEVIIAVAPNRSKKALFSVEERVELLQKSIIAQDLSQERVRIISFQGLLVEAAKKYEASAIIRGLRAVSDFEFEFQMALTNRRLQPEIETLFLAPREDCIFLSSGIVKEVSSLGGDISAFVTLPVKEALHAKFQNL